MDRTTLNNDIARRLIKITEDALKNESEHISKEKIARVRAYLQNYTQNNHERLPHQIRVTHESIASMKNPTASNLKSTSGHLGQPRIYSLYRLPELKCQKLKPKFSDKSCGVTGESKARLKYVEVEQVIITILENLANLLDNLHLFSRMPFFPQFLKKALKHTNSVWVVVLIFLIKRSITELMNLRKHKHNLLKELEIIGKQKLGSKWTLGGDIGSEHHKILSTIAVKRVMVYVEIGGNLLDLTLNVVELRGWKLQKSIMSGLNLCSMLMSIYRVNKAD